MADSFLKQVELGEGIICKKATQLYRHILCIMNNLGLKYKVTLFAVIQSRAAIRQLRQDL